MSRRAVALLVAGAVVGQSLVRAADPSAGQGGAVLLELLLLVLVARGSRLAWWALALLATAAVVLLTTVALSQADAVPAVRATLYAAVLVGLGWLQPVRTAAPATRAA